MTGRHGDRAEFLARIQQLNAAGRMSLRRSGVYVDPILTCVLQGGEDRRHGVTIVARPPVAVRDEAARIDAHLKAIEPDQYYYALSDLHLTMVEVLPAREQQEVELVARRVVEMMPAVLAGLPAPQLDSPMLVINEHACALNFLPADGTLQWVRREIVSRLARAGIATSSRYAPQSAHLTLMRYIAPLRTPVERWTDEVLKVPLHTDLTWCVSAVSVLFGTNWYGRVEPRREAGPFGLGGG
jgi:hypothetical protein